MLQTLPNDIETFRDRAWCRDPELRIEGPLAAERFIEQVGFCAALTDSRRPGPSLYIAVCGRRDAHTPRNVQKDPETSLAWSIKDELVRRGRVFYGKLKRNQGTFIARRLIPHFNSVWGVGHRHESSMLSSGAQDILRVLGKEWEMSTRDLRRHRDP